MLDDTTGLKRFLNGPSITNLMTPLASNVNVLLLTDVRPFLWSPFILSPQFLRRINHIQIVYSFHIRCSADHFHQIIELHRCIFYLYVFYYSCARLYSFRLFEFSLISLSNGFKELGTETLMLGNGFRNFNARPHLVRLILLMPF